jgi:hypothetical protein
MRPRSLFIKRQPLFEVKSCFLEPAEVQTRGAGLIVTDHRAARINAATQEWLGQLQDFRRLRPDQVIVAQGAERPERFVGIGGLIEQIARPGQRGGDIGRGKSLGHDKGVAELDLDAGFELLARRLVGDASQQRHGFFQLRLRLDAAERASDWRVDLSQ